MPDAGPFRCTFQPLGGIICLALSGDLDLASVATFRAHLAMTARDTEGLLLDLRDLRYLDSTGINALLDTYRASGPFGRRIALVGVSPNVRRILSVLNLQPLMPEFVSVEDALAYLCANGKTDRPLAGD